MISTALNPTQSVWNSLIPFWQTISTFFLWQSMRKVVYWVQIRYRECRKLPTHAQHPLYSLVEAIPGCIYIKFYHWANNHSKYTDGFYNSTIDKMGCRKPSPLIMFTCTALGHAVLEWQKNKDVHPKPSNSMLYVDRPDCSNYFNYKNEGGKITSCWAATGRKLLTSPGIADMYKLLMNTWTTLPESYQPRVYSNTLSSFQHQMELSVNPTPAEVISTEALYVDNAILLD